MCFLGDGKLFICGGITCTIEPRNQPTLTFQAGNGGVMQNLRQLMPTPNEENDT